MTCHIHGSTRNRWRCISVCLKNLLQIPSSRITFLLSLKVFTFITYYPGLESYDLKYLLNYFGFTKEQQAEAGRDSNLLRALIEIVNGVVKWKLLLTNPNNKIILITGHPGSTGKTLLLKTKAMELLNENKEKTKKIL